MTVLRNVEKSSPIDTISHPNRGES